MKAENSKESVGATAFDYRNNVSPKGYNKIYHGIQHVLRPTNNAAKVAHPNEVMRAVLEGK